MDRYKLLIGRLIRDYTEMDLKEEWEAGFFRFKRREEKVFCLNSGNCGSKYIVELLRRNGISQCYHEKNPDLDEEGVSYYLNGKKAWYLKLLIYLTRKTVYFESSNRLFALSSLIQEVFPNAKFIHLYRNGRDSVNSTINKTIWPEVIMQSERLRYSSRLAGPSHLSAFERTCLYWSNYNDRILKDLSDKKYMRLKFDDLISGNISHLEAFLGRRLTSVQIEPVNTKDDIKPEVKEFESWQDWPDQYKEIFDERCTGTMQKLENA